MKLRWFPSWPNARYLYLQAITAHPNGHEQAMTVAKLYWQSGRWNISTKDDTIGELAYKMCEEKIAAIAAERMGV